MPKGTDTDKASLVRHIREALRVELAAAERVARDTAEAANHPEARPENDKDTRKIELSYLAAGQAARARELEVAIAVLGSLPLRAFGGEDPLEVGALVELDVDGKSQRVFIVPAGGGTKLRDAGAEISVVTAQSPLGQALVGRTVGESFELEVAGRRREIEITSVE